MSKCLGLILLFFLFAAPVFPQNKPVELSLEIASIEKKLSDSKLSAAERKNALETMARLFELSGNAERAAEAWKEAALAVPGNSGHEALLQSARCYAALGEFDKAEAALKPVLADSSQILQNKARLIFTQLEALKTGNTGGLSNLLSNPDFAAQKPVLYYSILKISSDKEVQSAMASRLTGEFPQSPEARIVRNDTMVGAAPLPLWLLLGQPLVSTSFPAAENTPAENNPQTDSTSQTIQTEKSGTMLQTGSFSLEENAVSMAGKLRNAGFSPVIAKKTVNGKELCAVGVLPGSNPSQTAQQLKDKGFESFPTAY